MPWCLGGNISINTQMRDFNLNIAGYNIRFESEDGGPDLVPSERFDNFICSGGDPDFLIKVHRGSFAVPDTAEMVFNAPYVEEVNGLRLKKNDEFWSIYQDHNDLFIRTVFPYSPSDEEAVLKYSLSEPCWDLWLNHKSRAIDPLSYPLDGLILYYLTVISGDVMIHASGVSHNGSGYLFSGISGRGKTTMARLWDKHGAAVIHDDRLILRKTSDGYDMYNTPVYLDDIPRKSPLNRIFVIDHGLENRIIKVRGAEAVSLVMANCIQHNWDQKIIARLLDSISGLCEKIPASRLFFTPDKSIIDYISGNEKR